MSAISTSSALSTSSAPSTSPVRTLSRQTMSKDCKEIESLAENLDVEEARKRVRQLYQDGIQLAVSEVQGRPLIKETVFPIMASLGKVLFNEAVASERPLQRALSKTYRLFTELTWIQSWRFNPEDGLAVQEDHIQNIRQNVEKALGLLPRENAVNLKFQLRSTEEAAKCFYSETSVFKALLPQATTLFGAALNASPGDIISGLIAILKTAGDHTAQSWYLDTYLWRWETTEVKTTDALNKVLSKEQIEEAEENGGKYTVCLALIYMSIIKNDKAEKSLRKWAFQKLGGLLSLERPGGIGDSVSHPEELWRRIARQPDRFWKSRSLAMQYLKRLATKEKYKEFKNESRDILVKRARELNEKRATRYGVEKDLLKRKVEEFEKKASDLQDERVRLEDQSVALMYSGRGGGESKDLIGTYSEMQGAHSSTKDIRAELSFSLTGGVDRELATVESKLAKIEEDMKSAQEGISKADKIHTDEMEEISAILNSFEGV